MKCKTELTEFNPVIYPTRIWVGFNTPFEEIFNNFWAVTSEMERCDVTLDWYGINTFKIATTVPVASKKDGQIGLLVVIWKPSMMTTGVIAHESVHCADYICDNFGIEHGTFDNGEAYAYLVQWIAECIEKVKKTK